MLDMALRDEMLLLMDACRQPDACWELKYKTLMQVLFKAVHARADETAGTCAELKHTCTYVTGAQWRQGSSCLCLGS
jgi:hypothetical protein